MKNVKLVAPCEEYFESYLNARDDFKENSISFFTLEELENQRLGIGLQEGYVPASTFWLIDGGEFIGIGNIRHRLTPTLEKFGGHIGYSIRRSKWNQGYGTVQLEFLLKEAAKLGITKALVTCDEDNIGSARVMGKNGGVYQDTIDNIIDGKPRRTKRYCFNTESMNSLEIRAGENISMKLRTSSDAPEVFRVIDANRSYLREWLPWVDATNSVSVLEGVIDSWNKQYENGSDIMMGIYENDRYIGNIGLHDINDGSAMIGYWLAEGCQGNGIMTKCVRKLTDYGFAVLGLNRIYIHCAVGNKRSRAVPERLGFVQEGIIKGGENLHGVFHDLVVYAMTSLMNSTGNADI